ncbi:hypothetical protein FNF31_05314 [Cafeteria roenbergensis]|uniref:pyridoxal 5'-phosphate synthase n=2 Tax=Cafeteria roenbergensis TaxID=33653 RepID=A0A5A8D212_CAFRO|nr:hypothetical protein FNF31_05314 [Cafeteria roenbergensis]
MAAKAPGPSPFALYCTAHLPAASLRWEGLSAASRVAVLTTVRSLCEARLGDRKGLLELAPEFELGNLERLAAGDKLLKLAKARAEHADECVAHDATVLEAMSGGALSGSALELAAGQRHQLVCTLLQDCLTVLHNAAGISEALPTVGLAAADAAEAGTAAAAAAAGVAPALLSEAEAGAEDASLRELPPPPGPCEIVVETWAGGKGRPAESSAADSPTVAPLSEAVAAPDPLSQFAAWFAEAAAVPGGVPSEGQAVTLATSTPGGFPSARVVLLKQVDERGFVFFTNMRSRKGRELRRNPRAALMVHWPHTDPPRCVRVEGPVESLTPEESDAYFASRSRGSQVGAWASDQSTSLEGGRAALEASLAEAEARFAGGAEVPRPPHWGGVRVVPTAVEFWSNGASRLHDRLRFERQAGAGLAGGDEARADANMRSAAWRVSRLAP